MINPYRCEDCGAIFDEDEIDSRSEYVGEFWGTPAYQTFNYCPECGSDCIREYDPREDEDEETEEE